MMAPGRNRTNRVLVRFRFFINRYVGIMPPENSMVNTKMMSRGLRKGRLGLESG